jgi:hypothetical protein
MTIEDSARPEPELERQIRGHFVAARQESEVPSFESVMSRAEAADAVAASGTVPGWFIDLFEGWSIRWSGAVVVAAAAAVVVLITLQTDVEPITQEEALAAHYEEMRAAAEHQLLASLERTTRWRAPSDRWLTVETDIDIFGLPEFGSPEALKEKSTW